MVSSEKQAALNRTADRLSGLQQAAGWRELEIAVDEKCRKLAHTATVLALDPRGADQRKLDTIRGTIAALKWFVGVPREANATLERFMREQGIEMEEEIPVEY